MNTLSFGCIIMSPPQLCVKLLLPVRMFPSWRSELKVTTVMGRHTPSQRLWLAAEKLWSAAVRHRRLSSVTATIRFWPVKVTVVTTVIGGHNSYFREYSVTNKIIKLRFRILRKLKLVSTVLVGPNSYFREDSVTTKIDEIALSDITEVQVGYNGDSRSQQLYKGIFGHNQNVFFCADRSLKVLVGQNGVTRSQQL